MQIPLDVGATYWIDWYSADKSLSNWRASDLKFQQPGASPPVKINVAGADDRYDISCRLRDTSRSVLLHDGDTASIWIADISETTSHNGWNRFAFFKDFSGWYSQLSPGGDTISQPFTYTVASNWKEPYTYKDFRALITCPDGQIISCECYTSGIVPTQTGPSSMLVYFKYDYARFNFCDRQ